MPTLRKYGTNAERQAAYRRRSAALMHSTMKTRVPPVLGPRRWAALLAQAQELLADVAEEMANYWEERTEAWQNSERGEQLTDRMTAIEEIVDTLQDI
jgi:hypothetical protein